MRLDNPWHQLPAEPPFVLPSDAELIQRFNEKVGIVSARFIELETVLPEPFVGDPQAPIILLSNNPGFGKRVPLRALLDFRQRMLNNLVGLKCKYRFVYLDPDLGEAGTWWTGKLRHLIDRFGCEVVARSVLNITYFPYASRKFSHRRLELPSQRYSFGLVRTGVERGATIVLMRKGKLSLWLEKVPELKSYKFQLRNPRNPAISPVNCGPEDFEKLVALIERSRDEPRPDERT